MCLTNLKVYLKLRVTLKSFKISGCLFVSLQCASSFLCVIVCIVCVDVAFLGWFAWLRIKCIMCMSELTHHKQTNKQTHAHYHLCCAFTFTFTMYLYMNLYIQHKHALAYSELEWVCVWWRFTFFGIDPTCRALYIEVLWHVLLVSCVFESLFGEYIGIEIQLVKSSLTGPSCRFVMSPLSNSLSSWVYVFVSFVYVFWHQYKSEILFGGRGRRYKFGCRAQLNLRWLGSTECTMFL